MYTYLRDEKIDTVLAFEKTIYSRGYILPYTVYFPESGFIISHIKI